MKRFIRTLAGKTILFLLCVISTVVLIGSAIGIALMVEGNFYMTSKEEILSGIYDDMIGDSAKDILGGS